MQTLKKHQVYGRYDMLVDAPIIPVIAKCGMYADLMTNMPRLDKGQFDEYLVMATIDLLMISKSISALIIC